MKTSFLFLIGLFSFTALLRVLELIVAKRNKKINLEKKQYSYYKEKYYFLFIILHTSFLLFTPLEVYFFDRTFYLIFGIIGLGIYIFCLILRFHILLLLKEKWNTELVFNLTEESSIVTTGIYAYIRHPNYLVVILEIFSLSLFHSAWISLVLFSTLNLILLLKFRIPQEESFLFQNPTYKSHFLNKGRFLPKFEFKKH
ncbi:MAG: hypothetical protein N3A69_10940 [Leptospiraceae bacterium]|nr:hypothetical protein [Leptospiraceae bacterium]